MVALLCCDAFCWHDLYQLVPIEGSVFAMMKHFYPDSSHLFQDDKIFIHKAWGLTKQVDEDKNDVNLMKFPAWD